MRTVLTLILLGAGLQAQLLPAAQPAFDAARAFGARPAVASLSLSPDGTKVAYVAPGDGPGAKVFTIDLAKKTRATLVMSTDGKPLRTSFCEWVSNERLACRLVGMVRDAQLTLAPVYRLIAVNTDGSNLKVLSNLPSESGRQAGYMVRRDSVIDWLTDQSDGHILMMRQYAHNSHDHFSTDQRGMGVDLVDTRTLEVKEVEPPQRDAATYISDGRGNVRIMGLIARDNHGVDKGLITYEYRTSTARQWHELSVYHQHEQDGFRPVAVDPTLNVAYGFKKQNGYRALYSVSLDGEPHEQLVYAKPDVNMDGLIQIGHRIVGVSYTTDQLHEHYIVPEIAELVQSVREAIPQPAVHMVESSNDPDYQTMVFFADGEADPGVYYVFDRKTRHLDTFLVAHSELEGVKLGTTQAVNYPGASGTRLAGYLTLPPGVALDQAKGLPAIVLPASKTGIYYETAEFQWLTQFFAARGYAVLQPARYDQAWFADNGLQSWRTAVSDIDSGGRWLVSQGIADPRRLAIVGWHYGGYAAVQAAVIDPDLFKAIVAIAPITDLSAFKDELHGWSNASLRKDRVGSGPDVHVGSPVEHIDRITAPVLLFHGELDRAVSVEESKRLAARLTAAGKTCKLVTWPDLDDDLVDSGARAEMLRTSDQFMRQVLAPGADLAGTTPGARSPE